MAKKEPRELKWVEEELPFEEFLRKPMFGGFAYYFGPVLKLVMFEVEGDNRYRDHVYPFEVWNGCLFPAEREHHEALLQKFPFLVNHPVLPKWLYLPVKTEDFENLVVKVLKDVLKPNGSWGVIPKGKKPKTKTEPAKKAATKKTVAKKAAAKKATSKKSTSKKIVKSIDTKKPKMFG